MAETPQTSGLNSPTGGITPSKDPREDLKPQGKERAFYCSSPEFYVRKEGKPLIRFDKRWLVTSDAELIAHLLATTKSLKDAKVPISIIEVPVASVGTEPTPAMIEKGLGG